MENKIECLVNTRIDEAYTFSVFIKSVDKSNQKRYFRKIWSRR